MKSILLYLILFRYKMYSQPWIWITSTLKRYIAYRCLNIISNVPVLAFKIWINFKYSYYLSLTKWESELKWSDDSCVFFFVILNQTDMFLVHNQLMFCTNFTIIKCSTLGTVHTKLLYLFSLCFQNYVWLFCKNIIFRYIQASWGGEKKNHNWK